MTPRVRSTGWSCVAIFWVGRRLRCLRVWLRSAVFRGESGAVAAKAASSRMRLVDDMENEEDGDGRQGYEV